MILHHLWKFLVPLASQAHNSLFNRFRILIPHLDGANQEENCFLLLPLSLSLVSAKLKEKWRRKAALWWLKGKKIRISLSHKFCQHLDQPQSQNFLFLLLALLATNFGQRQLEMRGYFAQISMSSCGKKVVVQWCVQSVVRGTRRFAPFFLKSHVLGFLLPIH